MENSVLFEDYYDVVTQEEMDKAFSTPLGIAKENRLETLDITHLPHRHILISGEPGYGKSAYLHTVLNSIFLNYSPEQIQIWLHDCRGDEFTNFRSGYPPYFSHVSMGNSEASCIAFVQALVEVFKKRVEFLQENQENSFESCLKKRGVACIPRILVFIDPLDVFLFSCRNETSYVEGCMDRLLRSAFALGVTFIVTAQTCAHPWSMSRFVEMYFGIRICLCQIEESIRELLPNSDAIELAKDLTPGEAFINVPSIHKIKLLYISPEIERQIIYSRFSKDCDSI